MNLTTLCYIEQDGKYLMLHRTKKEHDENHGKWIGIGGHFEAMESPEECMRREIFEETGLVVESFRFRGIITFCLDGSTEYMHLFTVDRYSGDLHACDEGDLAWVEKEKVLSLNLWEGDRIFLKLLKEEHPFFSLKLVYEKDRLVSAELDGKSYPV